MPLHCRRAADRCCPCAVHCHRCHPIAVAPSITVAVAPSIADAVAPSINIVAVALPVCRSSLLLPLRFCRASIAVAIVPSIYVSVVAMTSITIIAVVFPSLHLSPLLSRCPSPSRHRRLAVVPSIFIVAVVLLSHHPSLSITVAIASPSRCSVAVVAAHHRPLLLIPSLIGCCVVFHCPLSSSHAVM